jgi:hypothetical protein
MALTAAQIVSLATTAAKVPGWITQAQQLLNVILADLADTQDLDLCQGITTFQMVADNGSGNGSGPYLLPADYKRAERDGVRYVYNGVPYIMKSIDLVEYYMQVQQAGIASFPIFFATDTSPLGQEPPLPAILWLWPPSSLAVPMSVQYRRLLPDIPTASFATEIPWFPNQEYLIFALTAKLCLLTDDTRMADFEALAATKLENFMKLTNDDEGRAKRVTLDSRRFGSNYGQLKNTKSIGW